jgi:hypothetical protein
MILNFIDMDWFAFSLKRPAHDTARARKSADARAIFHSGW